MLFELFKEVLYPNQKLACFVLSLKIINTFLKNDRYILWLIVQGPQKVKQNKTKIH